MSDMHNYMHTGLCTVYSKFIVQDISEGTQFDLRKELWPQLLLVVGYSVVAQCHNSFVFKIHRPNHPESSPPINRPHPPASSDSNGLLLL